MPRTDINGHLYTHEEGSDRDAFGRYRVSDPHTIFDSKMIANAAPLLWDDQEVSGSGTASAHQANQASVLMSVSAATAGKRVRQTFRAFNYQPGKSQQFLMTGVLGAGANGITRELGSFNDENGVFFRLSGSTMSVARRSYVTGSAVDTVVEQADWNIDTMDGDGPSGITLDVTKTQIFTIDYEWLGVGRVRFGFVIAGVFHYVHQMNHANVLDVVYMGVPNLPMRYSIENDGTGPAANFTQICTTVISEGGRPDQGSSRGVGRDVAFVTLNDDDIYPLIALRLKSGSLHGSLHPADFSLIVTSNANFAWSVRLNPTITGTALSFSGILNSVADADVATTNASKVTNGTILANGVGSQSQDLATGEFPSELEIGSAIDGTPDTLVLCVRRLTGAAETFYAAMNWHEVG